MDIKLTQKIKAWLDTPRTERDYDLGALLLLKLSGNKIMFNNITVNTALHAEFLEYNIQKYYNFRIQDITHQEVLGMVAQVEAIENDRFSFTDKNPAAESRSGKRSDHDSLPAEIQALFDDNLAMAHKMRELHLRLRTLKNTDSTCYDNERFPFLKEMIELDRKSHQNWDIYDHYVEGTPAGIVAPVIPDANEESKKALTLINFAKGRYAKAPSEEAKAKILDLFSKVIDPSDKLIAELTKLEIL